MIYKVGVYGIYGIWTRRLWYVKYKFMVYQVIVYGIQSRCLWYLQWVFIVWEVVIMIYEVDVYNRCKVGV